MDTKPKKPARNAETYLVKEDKRIYKNLVKAVGALKENMYPRYMPSRLTNALSSTAEKAYEDAEGEASKFWGSHEINAVRSKERGNDTGRIGCFYAHVIHFRLVLGKEM